MMVRIPVIYRGDWLHLKKGERIQKRFAHMEEFEIASMDGDCEIAAHGVDVGLEGKSDVLHHDGALWVRESLGPKTPVNPWEDVDPSSVFERRLDALEPAMRDSALFWSHAGEALSRASEVSKYYHVHAWMRCVMGRESRPNPKIHANPMDVTLEEARGQVRETVAGLRLHDGYLYRKAVAPTYCIGLKGTVKVEMLTVRTGLRLGRLPEFGMFGLDREEEMREFVAQAVGDGAVFGEMPEVLLPQALRTNDDEASLAILVRLAKEEAIAEVYYREETRPEAVEALDALIALDREPDAAAIDRFVAAAREYGDALAAGETDGRRAAWGRAMSAGAWRWNSRPIRFDGDGGDGLALEVIAPELEMMRLTLEYCENRRAMGQAPVALAVPGLR